MKKKNLILIIIAIVVVIVCVAVLLIKIFSAGDDDKKKNPVRLSDKVESTEDDEKTKSSKDEEDDKKEAESALREESDLEQEGIKEDESTSENTSEAAGQESVNQETTEQETTTRTEETTEESATQPIVTQPITRYSYEYVMIDGKSGFEEYNEKVISLFNSINEERTKSGKALLRLDEELCYIACGRASEMAYTKEISEVRPDGTYFYDLMKKAGISFNKTVENIAAGYDNAGSVVSGNDNSWKTSSRHYENLINSQYKRVGVGVDYSETYGYIWVAIFSD